MAWRVHLTNQAIQGLDILPGKPPLLIVWTQRDRATYFDLSSGVQIGEHQHSAVARQSDKWAEFAAGLVAPNGAHLPLVRTAQARIYTSSDGRLRLFWPSSGDLILELEAKDVKLEMPARAADLVAVGLDRFMGLIAALDAKGKLHLFQQHIRVGSFDLHLRVEEDYQPMLAVANGGAAIYASDGHDLVYVDTSGKVRKRLSTHYFIGRLVCSPDGKLLMTSDPETGVIRVYNGPELTPTYQRHALDLLQDADQLQLIADLPPFGAAPGAMAIDDTGALAFNISGVVCGSTLKQLDALPRPQQLL